MRKVSRHSFLLEAEASCSDCEWTADGGNAVAIAAQHAARKGHRVASTQTIAVNFGDSEHGARRGPSEPTDAR